MAENVRQEALSQLPASESQRCVCIPNFYYVKNLSLKIHFPSGGKMHFLLKTKGWDFFSVWQRILKWGFIIFSHSYLLSMRISWTGSSLASLPWLRSHKTITDKNPVNNWNHYLGISFSGYFFYKQVHRTTKLVNNVYRAPAKWMSLGGHVCSVLIVRLFSPDDLVKKERFFNSIT